MKTKLVYVLTCVTEGLYIEQALLAVYSARHWNQDAHIILVTDNLTDKLLKGRRSEILLYITEKVVIPFEDDTLSMTYRSRYIKTSIRQIVDGDFLFIDCDTITQRSLSNIDSFQCKVGAVLESHLMVGDFCESLFSYQQKRTLSIGVDLSKEGLYFSSGVLFVKDTPIAYDLYDKWFRFWQESYDLGMPIDQPALSKANREVGHIIEQIPDGYNCILFTQPSFTSEAFILHISSFRNPSFLFTKKVLSYIKAQGLNNDWIIKAVLNPCSSFLPFDYQIFHSTARQRRKWRKDMIAFLTGYGCNIDSSFNDFPMNSRFRSIVLWFFRQGSISLGIWLWMIWKRIHLLFKHDRLSDNVCRK